MVIANSKKKDNKDGDKDNAGLDDVFVKPKITTKLIKRSGKVIVERVNRFTYKGKISDMNETKEDKKEKEGNEHVKCRLRNTRNI